MSSRPHDCFRVNGYYLDVSSSNGDVEIVENSLKLKL